MTIYSLSNITRTFGDRTVLDIDSLEIKNGYRYALLGPNGTGKTTLLNILAFLDCPTTGNIDFYSKKVSHSEKFLFPLRQRVILIEQYPIMFSTTVYKNIEFGLKIRRFSSKEREHIIKEALELVGMNHMAQAKANTLSGGETQRVAMARALALSPEIILCDEPTSSIDIENQATIINLLKQINEEKGITIIFTTHDRQQALSLAHHIIFLDHGKIADTAYENIFTGVLTSKENGYSNCLIQNSINIKLLTDKEGKVRFLIDPCKVLISTNGVNSNLSNTYEGRVIQIAEENGKIRIVVDLSINIVALMTFQQYNRQQIIVGEKICIQIPTNAVQIL